MAGGDGGGGGFAEGITRREGRRGNPRRNGKIATGRKNLMYHEKLQRNGWNEKIDKEGKTDGRRGGRKDVINQRGQK